MGCHSLFPGDLPDPGIEPAPPVASALAGRFFTTEPPGKPAGIEWKKKKQPCTIQCSSNLCCSISLRAALFIVSCIAISG